MSPAGIERFVSEFVAVGVIQLKATAHGDSALKREFGVVAEAETDPNEERDRGHFPDSI